MYTVNSADSHVVETEDLWRERLPADSRDEILASVGFTPDGPFPTAAEVHPGCPRGGEPEERIKDLDEDGVWGEVLYPNMGILLQCATNARIRMPFSRAYNDWIADTYHATNPKRFAAAAMIPLGPQGDERIDEAVTEIHRVAKKGLRALLIPAAPPLHRPYSLPMYDPLWEAANDHGMVVTSHLGTSAERFFPEWEDQVDASCPDPASWTAPERPFVGRACPEMPPGAHIALLAESCLAAAMNLAWFAAGGVFERFPELHVVVVEGGAGWMGWLMDNLDTYYYARMNSQYPRLKEKPSTYVRRQGHAAFEYDSSAVTNLGHTGVESLLWSTDYPHEEGSWPNTQSTADQLFGELDEGTRHAIMAGTTGQLFGLEMPVG
jgi:predicted TIM-barrel fold metal-dependent hydrolase